MKWEYNVMSFQTKGLWKGEVEVHEKELQASLNEFGDDGWELITMFDSNKIYGQTQDIFAIFKRQK